MGEKRDSILIAKDLLANFMLLKAYVAKEFNRIENAENGLVAFEMCKIKKYDCIIMDIQMPIIDGLDATELIRKKDNSLNIKTPIIGITASSKINYEVLCLEKGMNTVLYKPIVRKTLVEEIRKQFGKVADSSGGTSVGTKQQASDVSLDYNRALSEFENEEQLLQETLEHFNTTLEEQTAQIELAIENKDELTIKRIAHKIRGAASNLTAFHIANVARIIEENDVGEKFEIVTKYFLLLKERKQEFNKYYKSLMKQKERVS